MHIHQVFFWLNEDLDEISLREFEIGLKDLTTISVVSNGTFGKPADTHRNVVDRSYSYGLILYFNDLADHNCYQADPIHTSFVERNASKWKRVQIYDIETSSNA